VCYREQKIEIERTTATSVIANIGKSRVTAVEVEVDWGDAILGEIDAWCSCRQYEAGKLCQHIWATLLAMDRRGIGTGKGSDPLKVLHYDELEYDDEDDDEGYVEDAEDDAPPFHSVFPGSGYGPAVRKQDWRQLLCGTDRQEADRALIARRPATPSGRTEPWYVLDVTASTHARQLVVAVHGRQQRKDGAFGPFTKLVLHRGRPLNFLNREDEDLVQMLLGCCSTEEGIYAGFSYSPLYSQPGISRFQLTGAIAASVLPRLCGTGRLVWLLDGYLPPEEGKPVAWDEGSAWRFRAAFRNGSKGKKWCLQGELYRDGQTLPLERVVLLSPAGYLLCDDRLARLDAGPHDFSWINVLRSQPVIEVPCSARAELLDSLCQRSDLPEIEFPPELRVEQQVGIPQGRLRIRSPQKFSYERSNVFYADGAFLYGDQAIDFRDSRPAWFDATRDVIVRRDRDREAALLQQIAESPLRAVAAYSGVKADYQLPRSRFTDIVQQLNAAGWIVESEGVRIRRPGTFHLSVQTALDWFELEGTVDFDGVSASLPDLLAALRSQERVVRLDDGSHGILPEEWLKRYGSLVAMGELDGQKLKFRPSQALLLDSLLAEHEQHAQRDKAFCEFREKLSSFGGVAPAAEPPAFRGALRPYQREGLGWLHFLQDFHFGGCLADDMGLGKTIQVLALLDERRTRQRPKRSGLTPSIVVAPKSLIFNWMDEAARFTPELRVLNYTGLDRKQRLADSGGYDVLLTTYGTLRRDIVSLKDIRFDYAVLDEAQAIKNHNAQAAKASRLLAAEHRLALTGTPIENHLGELWSLYEFLNPGMLGRSTAFAALSKNGHSADDPTVAMLAKGLRPFLLRRTKQQVLPDLPEKNEQTVYCEMSAEERKKYNQLRDYYRTQLAARVQQVGIQKAKIHVLEALLRLRQAACHPGLLDKRHAGKGSAKLETLLEQLSEITAEGHKALVFSQFTSLLAIVRQHLDKQGTIYEYLDGSTTDRGRRVKRFQEDDKCPLFLISLKAGGHGLNLTAADYVFILDPWWNPAVEAQAIDRVHRIGQSRRVFAYRLIAKNTVEDKILELQKTKRQLADAIISVDNSLIRQLTAEDLQLLLS